MDRNIGRRAFLRVAIGAISAVGFAKVARAQGCPPGVEGCVPPEIVQRQFCESGGCGIGNKGRARKRRGSFGNRSKKTSFGKSYSGRRNSVLGARNGGNRGRRRGMGRRRRRWRR